MFGQIQTAKTMYKRFSIDCGATVMRRTLDCALLLLALSIQSADANHLPSKASLPRTPGPANR